MGLLHFSPKKLASHYCSSWYLSSCYSLSFCFVAFTFSSHLSSPHFLIPPFSLSDVLTKLSFFVTAWSWSNDITCASFVLLIQITYCQNVCCELSRYSFYSKSTFLWACQPPRAPAWESVQLMNAKVVKYKNDLKLSVFLAADMMFSLR